jgi:phosphate transport system protein
MAKHLQRDLESLKREILALGTLVEEAIVDALHAVIERDPDLIEKVVEGDAVIDEREVEVEEECLKVLALHQPMAADLRFVVAVLKVNNDLERMGDLASTMAKRARQQLERKDVPAIVDFARIGELVRNMVRQSLDSLVDLDVQKARAVGALDQQVDEIHKSNYIKMKQRMMEDPACVESAVNALTISRALERIADLATNIAEDVVFMVDGEVVRHRDYEH